MADPRHVLKRALKRAADMGFTFYTHPEIEFFLLRTPLQPGVEPIALDTGGYFDHNTMTMGNLDFRRDAINILEQMGISVEFSHHEAAPGQHEIDLRYADALAMADNIMTFKVVLKEVAIAPGHPGVLRRSRSPTMRVWACTPIGIRLKATRTPSTTPPTNSG